MILYNSSSESTEPVAMWVIKMLEKFLSITSATRKQDLSQILYFAPAPVGAEKNTPDKNE